MKRQLSDAETEALRSKEGLEAEVVLATAKLETTRIDLVSRRGNLLSNPEGRRHMCSCCHGFGLLSGM